MNNQVVLVCGKSSTGKSMSLKDLDDPPGVMYLNCESGKRLPFNAKFEQYTITDPLQVTEALVAAEGMPHIHTVAVDTLTYLLEMYESLYIYGAADGMKAWSNFQQYFKQLMQQHVARSTKNVVFLAHTFDKQNEMESIIETQVPVKGALKNNGIESYFTLVIGSKKVPLRALRGFENDNLNITAQEEIDGFKYVYQTRLTKDTVNERLRSPIDLFSNKETFIDNNLQLVFNRLKQYYA